MNGAPGTTWSRAPIPGFLYQQNTLRDALVAAINLNIFHAHADRVRMTNIAQMVNVLQAMILTDKEKMLLTPTYHVFHMYKPFRGATQLPVELDGADAQGRVTSNVPDADRVRGARTRDGRLHIALVNLDPRERRRRSRIKVAGAAPKKLVGPHPDRLPRWTRTTPSRNPTAVEAGGVQRRARRAAARSRVEMPAKSIVVLSARAGK